MASPLKSWPLFYHRPFLTDFDCTTFLHQVHQPTPNRALSGLCHRRPNAAWPRPVSRPPLPVLFSISIKAHLLSPSPVIVRGECVERLLASLRGPELRKRTREEKKNSPQQGREAKKNPLKSNKVNPALSRLRAHRRRV